jgi:hypothetical protein
MWIGLAVVLAARLVATEGAPARPCLLDSTDRPLNCPAVAPPAPRQSGRTTTRPIPREACVNPLTHGPMKCLPEMLAPGRLEKAR